MTIWRALSLRSKSCERIIGIACYCGAGLCFSALALNNTLLILDKLLLPDINLFTCPLLIALVGLAHLLYGVICQTH